MDVWLQWSHTKPPQWQKSQPEVSSIEIFPRILWPLNLWLQCVAFSHPPAPLADVPNASAAAPFLQTVRLNLNSTLPFNSSFSSLMK